MKKRKLVGSLIIFVLASGVFLHAQNGGSTSEKPLTFGIKAGGAFSGFTNHQDIFTGTRSGVSAGAFVAFSPVSFVGVSLEVNYVQEGAFHANPLLIYPASTVNYTTSIYKTNSDIRLHTVQVPVLINVKAPGMNGTVVPKLILGYSFDFILNATSQDNYMISANPDIPLTSRSKENVTSSFESWNMGPVCGFGIDFSGDKLTYMLEARYKVGIRNINALGGLNTLNSQYDFSVNTFTVTLGIGF